MIHLWFLGLTAIYVWPSTYLQISVHQLYRTQSADVGLAGSGFNSWKYCKTPGIPLGHANVVKADFLLHLNIYCRKYLYWKSHAWPFFVHLKVAQKISLPIFLNWLVGSQHDLLTLGWQRQVVTHGNATPWVSLWHRLLSKQSFHSISTCIAYKIVHWNNRLGFFICIWSLLRRLFHIHGLM